MDITNRVKVVEKLESKPKILTEVDQFYWKMKRCQFDGIALIPRLTFMALNKK
jgi:hypothetical protein